MNTHYAFMTALSIAILAVAISLGGELIAAEDPGAGKEFEGLLQEGDEYNNAGNWDAAIAVFSRALDIKESDRVFAGIARANFGKAQIIFKRVTPWRLLRKRSLLREAEKNYLIAMKLDPQNLNWPYELAELYLYKENNDDAKRAVRILETIRESDPHFRDVALKLARAHELSNEREKADDLYEEALGEKPDARIYLQRALLAAQKDSLKAAEDYYLRAIESMDDSTEEAMLEYTGMLFSEKDKANWKKTPDRISFLRDFWLSRDPSPKTPENERIQEHWRRIAHAHKYFHTPSAQAPYDDRGEIYIKYGEPHYRFQNTGDMQLAENRIGAPIYQNESWTYDVAINNNNDGMIFDFANVSGYGFSRIRDLTDAMNGPVSPSLLKAMYNDRADVNFAYYGMIGSALSTNLSDLYFYLQEINEKKLEAYRHAPAEFFMSKDFALKSVPMNSYQASFRGKGGTTLYEIYYSVPLKDLNFREVLNAKTNNLIEETIVRRELDEEIWSGRNQIALEYDRGKSLKDEYYIGQVSFEIPQQPRAPVTHLLLEDPDDDRMTLASLRLSNRNFEGDSLMVSDMKFTYNVSPSRDKDRFTRNGLRVVPHASHIISTRSPVILYFEIYNLTTDPGNKNSYKIDYVIQKRPEGIDGGIDFFDEEGNLIHSVPRKGKNEYIALVNAMSGTESQEMSYLTMDITSLDEGDYDFLVYVTDMHTGRHAYSQRRIVLEKD